MIFDRTNQDVIEANSIYRNKVGVVDLTEEDERILERGRLTISTINRIETAQDDVRNMANERGYYGIGHFNKEWTYNDWFYEEDLVRLIDIYEDITKAFIFPYVAPFRPSERFLYATFNALEKILQDAMDVIGQIDAYVRECDTFYCGE